MSQFLLDLTLYLLLDLLLDGLNGDVVDVSALSFVHDVALLVVQSVEHLIGVFTEMFLSPDLVSELGILHLDHLPSR